MSAAIRLRLADSLRQEATDELRRFNRQRRIAESDPSWSRAGLIAGHWRRRNAWVDSFWLAVSNERGA